eukprot:1093562_1
MITDPMIEFIKTHDVLYDTVDSDELSAKNTKVISRLVKELGVEDAVLIEKEKVASANVECIPHDWSRCLEFKFNTSGAREDEHTKLFETCEYKMVSNAPSIAQDSAVYFEYDGHSAFINMERFAERIEYDVFIKNADFFGMQYILCGEIQIPALYKTCPFYDKLKEYHHLIQLANIQGINEMDKRQIVAAQYALVTDRDTPLITAKDAKHAKYFIQKFDKIKDIHFVIPFYEHKEPKVSIYIQIKGCSNFIRFKTFSMQSEYVHEVKPIDYIFDA